MRHKNASEGFPHLSFQRRNTLPRLFWNLNQKTLDGNVSAQLPAPWMPEQTQMGPAPLQPLGQPCSWAVPAAAGPDVPALSQGRQTWHRGPPAGCHGLSSRKPRVWEGLEFRPPAWLDASELLQLSHMCLRKRPKIYVESITTQIGE